MKMSVGSNSITIKTPASYPMSNNVEIVQATERSAAGKLHVESFHLQVKSKKFVYEDLPEDEYLVLVDFFLDHAKGGLNPVHIEDDKGDRYQARFTSGKLDFSLTNFSLWAGSFSMELV